MKYRFIGRLLAVLMLVANAASAQASDAEIDQSSTWFWVILGILFMLLVVASIRQFFPRRK